VRGGGGEPWSEGHVSSGSGVSVEDDTAEEEELESISLGCF
jgi:hypothetical protein